jgi:Flp pilus assembly protein TadD
MELTVEQAMQQGAAAHKEGKLQDAERLYRAILQSQPLHPDANHNLGVIAVSFNKADVVLPLFKKALEANPTIEQFWLSYIDALIKEQQLDNAKQVLEHARKQGVAGENLNVLEEHLALIVQAPKPTLPEQKKSLTFSEKRKKLAEQKKKKLRKQNLEGISPSQEQLTSLLEHYQNGRFEDAEKLAVSITQKFSKHQFGWKVLGALLQQTGRFRESLVPNQKAVALSPQDAAAHSNLGVTLKKLGRLEEAEASYKQAIALKYDYAEAHNNLGVTLHNLGRLDEAEASYKHAIALKSDYAEPHNNLGDTLQDLGRLDEAEVSYTHATALKPDYALAHYGLGKVFYIKGNEDLAQKNIVKANDIEPQSKDYELLRGVMEVRKSRKANEAAGSDRSSISALTGLISSPLILNRVVEAELIASLYEMNSLQLDKTQRVGLLASGKVDARYGNGIVSPGFNLFEDARSIIKKLAEDLTKIMMKALKSDIYIYDSFFNILSAGGGTTPHNHLTTLDRNIALDLGKQKYSLVYYLSVGDQNCDEPGMLKLYEPDEDILPCEGMIAIIPASRMHSAVYGGKTDRVMIGVNFYSL